MPTQPRPTQEATANQSNNGSSVPPQPIHNKSGAMIPAPHVTQVPSYCVCEPSAQPYRYTYEDPVFEVREAAAILGLSKELLDKWRERNQGPDYIQYGGHGGPVRYRLSALESFKESFSVRPSGQRSTRRYEN